MLSIYLPNDPVWMGQAATEAHRSSGGGSIFAGVVVGVVVVTMLVRWRLGHRERRAVELRASRAAIQPLTPWSARYPKRGHRGQARVTLRRRRWGAGF